MKRYLILSGTVLLVLTVAWTALGQAQDRPARQDRGMFGAMSGEEAAQMRQRWQNMSEEEREKLRTQMRERFQNMPEEERARLGGMRRGRMGREEQLAAIKTIEENVAKLKANIGSSSLAGGTSFRDMSEEERTQWRERFMKAREVQEQAIQTIITQIAALQGQRPAPPTAEGATAVGAAAVESRLIIINVRDLQPIQELATKENATETARRLERLINRGRRGFRGGFGGQRGGTGPGRGARGSGAGQ